ncbi:MAG TPA: hypothetical protein VHT97_05930, partial [Acidimicrobiales bacterium]|nr:hypothetical protein [Acidimicrobiales bacterium]
WRTSPVLARLKAAAGPVYSNAFDGIEFSTGRGANPLPAKVEYLTGRVNPDYDRQLRAMADDLGAGGGLLAYFDAVTFRQSLLPTRAELERALPLEVVTRDAVGTLYRLRPPNGGQPRRSSATR